MRLKQLVLDRFKSFKERTVFDFNVSDRNKNIVLIGGDNGFGKTSLLEALNIVLYGEDSRNIIHNFNNSAARENKGGCVLELEYEDDDGNVIRISRRWIVKGQYASKEDIRESMVDCFFSASRNGTTWNINENEWFEEIDAKMPKSVSEFFFFEGEKIKDMASDEVPDLLKKSMEKIIGLEPINTLISDLRESKKKLLDSSVNIKSEDIEDKKALINAKHAEYNKKETLYQEKSNKLRELEHQLTDKNDEFRSLFGVGTDEAKKLKEIDLKVEELNQELGGINAILDEFFNQGLPFAILKPFFKDIQSNIKKTEEYENYINSHKHNEEIRNKIIEGLYMPRDVIRGNEWDEDNRSKLEDKISEILNEEKKEKPNISISSFEKGIVNNIIISNSKSYSNLSEKQNRKDDILRQLKNYEWEKENLQVSDDKKAHQEKLSDEIKDLTFEISHLKSEKSMLSDEMKRIKGEIIIHEKDYDKMREGAVKSEKDKRILKRIDSYIEVLEEFKVELRTSKIGTLQTNIEKMFKLLYNKGNVSEISIDPDSFNIQIFDLDGHRKYQAELSEGEKSLLAISLIRGLSKTSNLELPILTDAPLSVLDKGHRNNVLENYFPNASSQVIILIKEIDLLPNSEGYNLIKSQIGKSFTLDFDKEKDITTLHHGYFTN